MIGMPQKENSPMNTPAKKLSQLAAPLFLEILCVMLAGMVDTLMLTSESDQAVGAVGTANTYISIFLILFNIISSGMTAVMAQYIGAGRPGVAGQVLRLGLAVNLAVGGIITATLVGLAGPILSAIGIASQLKDSAAVYMRIVGAFCLCNALAPIYSGYLRSFGQTAPIMAASLASNAVNLILNAVFLFALGWGVAGVALATGISRLVNLLWVWAASRRRIPAAGDPHPPVRRMLLRQVLRIGLPAAAETSLYDLAVTLVISLLNRMDNTGLQATARAYTVQFANLSYCAAAALAQANAILAGWRIGGGHPEECDRGTRRTAWLAVGLGVAVSGVFALSAPLMVPLFTSKPEMIRLVSAMLWIDILLEIGRASNLVYGSALKAAGDALYPMLITVTFAFLCAVGGTWLFGLKLGWLAMGAYAAMALDECVRAVFVLLRWRSGRWKQHTLLR